MTEHTTDKKIETMTKECLYTALLLLMEKKPYEDITITEIAKKREFPVCRIIGFISRKTISWNNMPMKYSGIF